jgi:two-component system sensor histidine kinase VicK
MVEINQALGDMLWYTNEQVTNTGILDYTHSDFIAYWYDLHKALWKNKLLNISLEACLIRKDGKKVWCVVYIIRLVDRSETMGYTILEEITQRKQLER